MTTTDKAPVEPTPASDYAKSANGIMRMVSIIVTLISFILGYTMIAFNPNTIFFKIVIALAFFNSLIFYILNLIKTKLPKYSSIGTVIEIKLNVTMAILLLMAGIITFPLANEHFVIAIICISCIISAGVLIDVSVIIWRERNDVTPGMPGSHVHQRIKTEKRKGIDREPGPAPGPSTVPTVKKSPPPETKTSPGPGPGPGFMSDLGSMVRSKSRTSSKSATLKKGSSVDRRPSGRSRSPSPRPVSPPAISEGGPASKTHPTLDPSDTSYIHQLPPSTPE